LVFVPKGELAVYTGESTTAQIWEDERITSEDVEHIMSMTFLDVRLKNYIEIRFADSMPFPHVLGYLAFIKGIFYNEQNLDFILTQCVPDEARILSAKASLIKDGFEGTAYDQNAAYLLSELLTRAEAQLDAQEQSYLQPFKEIIKNKRTLAKDYYEEHIIAISGRN
jgi:glutamate--cysteine ligase